MVRPACRARLPQLTHEGLLLRNHEGRDWSTGDVAIGLASDETALSDAGPVATIEAPMVWVLSDDTSSGRHTGPELRQLASALLNAADEWDRITGVPVVNEPGPVTRTA